MSGYRVRPLTPEEARSVAAWRYSEELSNYDGAGEPLDPAEGFWAVEDEAAAFIGYCCFGEEARVPGLAAEAGVVDVGVGMAPEHVGGGRARTFVEAVLDFGSSRLAPDRFRAVVLDWNQRSLAACRNAGFVETGEVTTDAGRFVILERPAESAP